MLYNGQDIQHESLFVAKGDQCYDVVRYEFWASLAKACQWCQLKQKYRPHSRVGIKIYALRVCAPCRYYFWDILTQCLTLRVVSMICDKNSRLFMRPYYVLSVVFFYLTFS